MEKTKYIESILSIFLVLGALNWGSIGLFNLNLANKLFKRYPSVEKLIYILVGIAGLYAVIMAFS